MKIRALTYALMALLLLSCSNNKTSIDSQLEIIDLSNTIDAENYSELEKYIDSVEIIPLETSENCYIRSGWNIHIAKDRIIVFDEYDTQHQIKVFDRKGKWIASSTQGQGPGEIIKAYDIAYDHELDRIIVHQNKWISVFDKDLNHISDMDCLAFDNMVVANNKYFFKARYHQKNEELGDEFKEHQIIVTDKNLNAEKGLRSLDNDLNISSSTNFFVTKDGISFVDSFCDTIFVVDNKSITPKYILEYPSKKKRPEIGATAEELNEFMETSGFVFTTLYKENDTHQYVRLIDHGDKKAIVGYRDKKTKKVIPIKVDLHNIFCLGIFSGPLDSYTNMFAAKIEYKDIGQNISVLRNHINESEYQILKNMDEEANPILVLYSFNPFE